MVKVVEHDLEFPLPDMGYFDAVISVFRDTSFKAQTKIHSL